MNDLEWKIAAGTESYGSNSHIGISIRIHGEITDEIRRAAQNHCHCLHEELEMIELKNNPVFKEAGERDTQSLIQCFGNAGISPIYIEKKPNEYDPKYFAYRPWLIVTTSRGRIKIGWRKRVISIDWSDSEIKSDGNELFADEKGTTDTTLVHAWSYEKATEYLAKLMKSENPSDQI